MGKETAVSVLTTAMEVGLLPVVRGTERVIAKAKAAGIAVMLSRNHGHFGAAGIYARMTLGHDLLCYVTSGHQLLVKAGQPLYDAGGGSPMAFSAPTLEEDPVVLDFGAMHDLYGGRRDELAEIAPGMVLRSVVSVKSVRRGVDCSLVWDRLTAAVDVARRQSGAVVIASDRSVRRPTIHASDGRLRTAW
jgi:hypothetical protein